MSVVLVTDSTLMPDLEISTTPIADSDAEVSTSILEDLSNAISDSSDDSTTKAYVNSMITEVTVNTSGVDLDHLYLMKPTTDIVSVVSHNISKQCNADLFIAPTTAAHMRGE
jgi:hypothetical protein